MNFKFEFKMNTEAIDCRRSCFAAFRSTTDLQDKNIFQILGF